MARKHKPPKQQTLEATLGMAPKSSPAVRTTTPRKPPPPLAIERVQTRLPSASQLPSTQFMSKRGGPIVLSDDSSDDAEEVDQIREDEDAEPVQLPSRSRRAKRPRSEDGSASEPDAKRQQKIVLDDDSEEEDDDDMPLATPASARARGRKPVVRPDEDDSDEDIVSPAKRRRRLVAAKSASPSPDLPDVTEVRSSKQDVQLQTPKKTQSSPTKRGSRSARTGHRTFKEKQKEVLRRRRQGENITIEELTESSSDEEDQKGEYDTDSDFAALDEFDDEEEEAEEQPSSPLKQHKKRKDKAKKTKSAEKERSSQEKGKEHGEYNDEDLEDFVVEDDEGPLGVPAHLLRQEIPLEFTSHAHKPLKAHFKDAVEWLVQRRLNPAFDKDDGLYKIAWRKLDDEVRGLAQSKFMSSGWKPEFYKALRARPYLESYELDRNDPDRGETCHACGRSNHPATFKIALTGSAYYKDSLEDVESDSDSEDDGSEDEGSRASHDEDGNTLQPQHKEWFVGVVCNSNAETAHSLIHWKHALMDWVGENLEKQGFMTAAKLKEREKMKGKKRRRLANETVDQWEASGIIKALWGDFKKNLEEARTKSTTVVGRRGRR